MGFYPEHLKWDQNPKFTPLSKTMTTPVPCMWDSHKKTLLHLFNFIQSLGELWNKVINIIHQTEWHILNEEDNKYQNKKWDNNNLEMGKAFYSAGAATEKKNLSLKDASFFPQGIDPPSDGSQ